jgi:transcriptional regulator with XRE-family HTH domain
VATLTEEALLEELKRLREEKGWSQTRLAQESGVDRATINQVEGGRRSTTISTLELLATALGTEVADFFPKAQAPLPFEDVQRRGAQEAAEPLPPKLRRYAAWARRAELDRVLKHLTLRLETLRGQAKTLYEAGAAPEELWPLFMDSVLLARGAEALLIDSREEAQELGGETEEERRLRGRLEHRTEDASETREKIGDMWNELLDAKTGAENEALRKELRAEAELPDQDKVRPFRRKRAV